MKSIFKTSSLFLLIFIFCLSCSKVYYTPDCDELSKQHKTIAILPSVISITPGRKSDAATLREQERSNALIFQKEIFSWMLKRKMQGKFLVEIIDVETINAKLNNILKGDSVFSPVQLCKKLGVDGVITSTFNLSKPMSEAGAIVVSILTDVGTATNEVKANISIYDNNSEKMIWNYNNTFSGGIGSTPTTIVDNLMRNCSRKMPYNVN